ncbi:hypothetical protein JTE90_004758 [Oedothorax gibbosus]|uniref:Uncharacterized protein n=1 Tax=Oedothorax gibbosus TaxID=931172 RepID=A0AAV6UWG2_9ARAC|nr:hypothetical protein JTE90_004758 [Oedothorax gibbosus]
MRTGSALAGHCGGYSKRPKAGHFGGCSNKSKAEHSGPGECWNKPMTWQECDRDVLLRSGVRVRIDNTDSLEKPEIFVVGCH